jgi:hypothetical protein
MADTKPPFNPNDGLTPDGKVSSLLLPSTLDIDEGKQYALSGSDYLRQYEMLGSSTVYVPGSDTEVVKASSGPKPPPSSVDAGRILFSASAQYSGVLEWPGFSPFTLRQISRQSIAPQMIIGMRCADVLRYSDLSKQAWKPGWRIELLEGHDAPDEAQRKDIRAAETFLANSCIELGLNEATERDQRHYSSFASFLDMAVRDTLTYAAIALWKDVDQKGRVKSYALLPAANVRFTGMKLGDGRFVMGGFNGDPEIATALVSEDGTNVVQTFTREQLTFFIRNPRTDVDIFGYGYPEIEQAFRAIQGFQNALEMNNDAFNRSAIPNGILVLSGGQVTQRQLDLINRVWTNLKKGVTKSWALPVMGLSEGSKVEILDLSRMKGNEAYYKEYMNMLAGILCTLWKFPVNRLGYKTSGQGHDTQPLPDAQANETDADDPGLAPLLMHLENMINSYLIWTNWPHLRFTFTGKSPKEDARQYEARRNAMTLRESRAEADLPSMEEEYKGQGPEAEFAAMMMDMCPLDPGMQGTFQSLIATLAKAKFEPTQKDADTPGARMTARVDPAKAEAHGKTSGVRSTSGAKK